MWKWNFSVIHVKFPIGHLICSLESRHNKNHCNLFCNWIAKLMKSHMVDRPTVNCNSRHRPCLAGWANYIIINTCIIFSGKITK